MSLPEKSVLISFTSIVTPRLLNKSAPNSMCIVLSLYKNHRGSRASIAQYHSADNEIAGLASGSADQETKMQDEWRPETHTAFFKHAVTIVLRALFSIRRWKSDCIHALQKAKSFIYRLKKAFNDIKGLRMHHFVLNCFTSFVRELKATSSSVVPRAILAMHESACLAGTLKARCSLLSLPLLSQRKRQEIWDSVFLGLHASLIYIC